MPLASAQTSDETEDILELSPFEVTASEDFGYQAKSTLAGSRTRTDLKNIPNALDIFTEELIEDLAVNDVQDLAKYASNVSTMGVGTNNESGIEWEIWNYDYMEIRGFKVSRSSRNFMSLGASYESYNSDRATISKGPNAVLYGTGDPGGALNYTTKVPQINNDFGNVQLRLDSEGSKRASTDINKVLIEDKLAIRLNLLKQDLSFYRGPSYNRMDAATLAMRWKPFEKTTVTLSHEFRDGERASPRGSFPIQRISTWFENGQPLVDDVLTNANGSAVVIGGQKQVRLKGTDEYVPANSVVLDVFGQRYFYADGSVTEHLNWPSLKGLPAKVGRDIYYLRESVDFPFTETVSGANSFNDTKFNLTELNVTHQLSDDLFVELSFGRNKKDTFQGMGFDNLLQVDPDDANGHQGEYYVDTNPYFIDRDFEYHDARATISYDFEFGDNIWLGHHTIAGMYERNTLEEIWDTGKLMIMSTPTGEPASQPNNAIHNSRRFWVRSYLDFDNGIYSAQDNRDIFYSDGINQDGFTTAWKRTINWGLHNSYQTNDTMLGVLQSFWLDNKLVTTIGYREERNDQERMSEVTHAEDDNEFMPSSFVPGAPAGTRDPHYAARDVIDETFSPISRNYGAVYHINNWMRLSANYATNASPRTESYNLHRDFIPSATGKTEDYGVHFSLLEDKMHVSLLHYETSSINDPLSMSDVGSPQTQMRNVEQILFENGIIPDWNLEFSGNWSTQNRVAKGEELTIIANPNRHWNLRFVASRTVNEPTNLAPEVRAYYAQNRSLWEGADGDLVSTQSGLGQPLGFYVAELTEDMALLDAREKVRSFPSHEYVARFVGKYNFDNYSVLKGLSLGTSLEWKSAPIISYFYSADNVFDINTPMKGEEVTTVDLFFTYRRQLSEKFDWKIQLNISNVFDDKGPRPAIGYSIGTDPTNFSWGVERYQPVDGRIWTLTTTLGF